MQNKDLPLACPQLSSDRRENVIGEMQTKRGLAPYLTPSPASQGWCFGASRRVTQKRKGENSHPQTPAPPNSVRRSRLPPGVTEELLYSKRFTALCFHRLGLLAEFLPWRRQGLREHQFTATR